MVTARECPWCYAFAAEADFVDNGVGMQQVGPYGCEVCHAVEMSFDFVEGEGLKPKPRADGRITTEEEIKRGWWKGDSDGP